MNNQGFRLVVIALFFVVFAALVRYFAAIFYMAEGAWSYRSSRRRKVESGAFIIFIVLQRFSSPFRLPTRVVFDTMKQLYIVVPSHIHSHI